MLINRTDDKPWDAQIAYRLIYPLRNTFVTPNYLTSLRLIFGILAGVFFDFVNFNIVKGVGFVL